MSKAVAVVSGGLDSITLAYLLDTEGHDLHLVTFDYGQRCKKEIGFSQLCARRLRARYSLVDLRPLGPLLSSALTDKEIEVPEGRYSEETLAPTFVPNRNPIFLSIAFGIAVAEGAQLVAIGIHGGDHPIYPNCSFEFAMAFQRMEEVATKGMVEKKPRLYAPFAHLSKHEIIRIGARLGVPYGDTWSCYKGGELHCGRCATCIERKEAFQLAGVEDPTVYA